MHLVTGPRQWWMHCGLVWWLSVWDTWKLHENHWNPSSNTSIALKVSEGFALWLMEGEYSHRKYNENCPCDLPHKYTCFLIHTTINERKTKSHDILTIFKANKQMASVISLLGYVNWALFLLICHNCLINYIQCIGKCWILPIHCLNP